MKTLQLILGCLLAGASVFASPPRDSYPKKGRALPCQGQDPERSVWPNGNLLWGTGRTEVGKEKSSVLAAVDARRGRRGAFLLKGVHVKEGHLAATPFFPKGLVGAVFQGIASDGHPVEVALCGAEPVAQDPAMVWYRIEIWNAGTESWENPCVATQRVPEPRALAVKGVWDETGARRDNPDQFTFACENGAIAKCVTWGYKPWEVMEGRSLQQLHQACTRMARADYCGDGHSHTLHDTPIDMYDDLSVQTRAREATEGWEPERANFEAAWTPDGAWCLSHTRDGQAAETILAQCPGRFEMAEEALGEDDRCTVRRKGERVESVLLRNRSYYKTRPSLHEGAVQ
ncbi:ADYC domain-containing protein [Hyalangium versicolor]|uniref:ADYC domain-containing protein n=1 Tax=Hyalangium versicolor TaxID=2861190 RepID=UPI001CCD56D6|nr:ADYC domain-containing protein [Hyalangium versicolor]